MANTPFIHATVWGKGTEYSVILTRLLSVPIGLRSSARNRATMAWLDADTLSDRRDDARATIT